MEEIIGFIIIILILFSQIKEEFKKTITFLWKALFTILYFILGLFCFPFIKIKKVQEFLANLWEKIKDTTSL